MMAICLFTGSGRWRIRLRGAVSTIAAAIVGLTVTPALAELETVTCESLSIGIDGADYVQACSAGEFTITGSEGAPFQLYVEDVVATGPDSRLLIASYKAGSRAYLMTRSAEWFVSNYGWFDSMRNWGEAFEVEEFEAVPFDARPQEAAGFRRCIGFVRFLQRVPRSFAGYRKAVGGAYCKDQDGAIPAAEVRSVLQRLEF